MPWQFSASSPLPSALSLSLSLIISSSGEGSGGGSTATGSSSSSIRSYFNEFHTVVVEVSGHVHSYTCHWASKAWRAFNRGATGGNEGTHGTPPR